MTASEQIIQVLDDICAKFGVAIDWTAQNVMPYIQELMGKYIKYEIWTSAASFVMTGILLLALIKFTSYFWKKADFDSYDFDAKQFAAITGLVAAILTTIVFICVFFHSGKTIITCLTFPEKIIFDALKVAAS